MKFSLRLFVVMVMTLLISVTMTSAQDEGGSLAINDLPAGTVLDQWAVVLQPGADVTSVAASLGFDVLRPVGNLANTYLLRLDDSARSATVAQEGANRLNTAPEVVWFQQQYVLPLELKQAQRDPNGGNNYEGPAPQNAAPAPVAEAPADPLVVSQWHVTNTGQFGGTAGNDARIEAAWDAGYTGNGVVVSAVEGGVENTHTDIAPNFNMAGSNTDGTDFLAAHGTSVAGVMAAAANGAGTGTANCGVGVAYDAQVSSVSYTFTDAGIAGNINFANQINDVYNNSWGPSDNGSILFNLNDLPLTEAMFQDAVANGRGGLGSIIVWAAGNGRKGFPVLGGTLPGDNVNADGLASAIQTIAVGAFTNNGVVSGYSEPGASMLVTGPSNGGTIGIVATDRSGAAGYNNGEGWSNDCTDDFGGTSSSSPLVAGVVALMLEANPNLTWRDVQYILAQTAWQVDPTDGDWTTNGAGMMINHNYGFGAVDAGAATAAAATWTNVGAQTTSTSAVEAVGAAIPDNNTTGTSDTVSVTDDFTVEHVEINFSATHANRSHLEVELTSPAGTVSRMIYDRDGDTGADFNNHRMMTVRNWGENSVGNWTLTVKDLVTGTTGTFDSWQLIVHGTNGAPGGSNIDIVGGDTCSDSIGVTGPTTFINGDLATGYTDTIANYNLDYTLDQDEYAGNDAIFGFVAGPGNDLEITLTSGDPGNTDYQIILLSECGFGNTVVANGADSINDANPEVITVSGLPIGTYYLYVDTWAVGAGYPSYGPFSLEFAGNFGSIASLAGDPARITPSDTTVISTGDEWPMFEFEDSGEEWYQVWIGPDDYSSQSLYNWYDSEVICNGAICTIPIDVWGAAANDSYEWWISSWSNGDTFADIDASWDTTTFTVDYGSPVDVAPTSPTGTVNTAPTEVVWARDATAIWYQVWVGTDDYINTVTFNWFDAREICTASNCTLDLGGALADGSYEVWIEAWGPGGYKTWTGNTLNPSTFTVATMAAAAIGNDGPTTVSPESPSRAGSAPATDAPAAGNDGPTTVSPSRGG